MEELKVFNNPRFGEIRTLMINGEPWFIGKDVAKALGYGTGKSLNNAVANHVEEDDKGVTEMMTPGGKQKLIIINESGLYSLIFSSKLPAAKQFKRWVTSEVLPTIRLTGGYQVQATPSMERIIALTVSETVKQLLPYLVQNSNAQDIPQCGTAQAQAIRQEVSEFICESESKLKIETFPQELRVTINMMMETMAERGDMNFSAIARYCTSKGFQISSPAVKKYYTKHF